jgi:hypothetical protein
MRPRSRAPCHLHLPTLPRLSAASPRSWPELEAGPPLVIVTDLQGACEHAAAFGELEGQTLEEAWTLIEVALDVASGERGGYA